ncbi:MAG: peptide ABC transporter substrate-binding protein [Sinobacteraceae bacterium]|nr:peptide ABC transporter substrate-binding protein [Nevskiaceae bacterium]
MTSRLRPDPPILARMQRRDFIRQSVLAACVATGSARVFADSSGTTLRRSRGGTLTSLDPHRGISATDMEINADLFVGLTAIDARGAITPGLASEWTVSADGRRYEFRLRRNLRWSDGSSLDAVDVVASFRRMLAADTGMLLAYRYDAIVGAEGLRRGKASSAALGVRAGAAPGTVIFELLRPETDLLKLLAVAYVVPVRLIERLGRDWAKPPAIVVNGAYRPTSWAQNGRLTLAANPRWYGAGAQAMAPQLEWITGIDDATRLRLFRSAELDIAQLSEASVLKLARAELGSFLHSVPFYGGGWLGLNLRRGALADRRVREALSLAIDRRVLCDKVRGLGEQPTESLVPQAVGDYPVRAAPAYAAWPMPRRVAAARELLRAAGISGAQTLRLVGIFSSNPLTQRTFLAIDAMWAPLGVRLEARGMESRAYNTALNAGEFDLMDYGPFSAVQSATSFIGRFQSGSFLNYSGYADAEVDRLISTAEASVEPSARARGYLAVERLLVRDLPVIPLYSGVTHRLVAARVRGWVDNSGLASPSQFLSLAARA